MCSSDLVQSEQGNSYFYPDVVIVCGSPHLGLGDTLQNATAIFEVLSPSTERHDRTKKLRSYQTIETLQEYFLVSQDMALVEAFRRRENGEWTITHYVGRDTSLPLESVGISIPLDALYDNVQTIEEIEEEEENEKP